MALQANTIKLREAAAQRLSADTFDSYLAELEVGESPDGVVSPGGVGYDVTCGVRLLALPLIAAELGNRTRTITTRTD